MIDVNAAFHIGFPAGRAAFFTGFGGRISLSAEFPAFVHKVIQYTFIFENKDAPEVFDAQPETETNGPHFHIGPFSCRIIHHNAVTAAPGQQKNVRADVAENPVSSGLFYHGFCFRLLPIEFRQSLIFHIQNIIPLFLFCDPFRSCTTHQTSNNAQQQIYPQSAVLHGLASFCHVVFATTEFSGIGLIRFKPPEKQNDPLR